MRILISIAVVCVAVASLAAQEAPSTPPQPPVAGEAPAAQEPVTSPAEGDVSPPSEEPTDARDAIPTPSVREEKPAPAAQDLPLAPVAVLTRLADPVAALDAETRVEKLLFHWEKTFGLRVGDGLRQGVAAIAEIFFPDDLSEIRCFGSTHLFLEEVKDADGNPRHLIRVIELRRMRIDSRKTPKRLSLPGGTTITFSKTVVQLALDERDHRYHVKNDGPGEVRLEGPIVPLSGASVLAGHEVQIPLVVDAATAMTQGRVGDSWAGRSLELDASVRAVRQGESLELTGTGVARVGGARIVLNGSPVRVYKPRGGFSQ